MNNYLFVYTRTKNVDYRNVFGLSADICPEYVQDMFLKRISAVLNKTDNAKLASPVLLYFCQDNYVLYGYACLNKVLSSDYCTDKTNGSIRGFIGILTNSSEILEKGIAYSIDFYQSLYSKYVVPEWETYTSRCKENQTLSDEIFSEANRILPKPSSVINTDSSICRLFSVTYDSADLLAEAMGAQGNVSIALNVDNEDQVSLPDYYPLTNALLKTSLDTQYEDIAVKHRCDQCKKDVDRLYKNNLCRNCWDEGNRPILPRPGENDYCKMCGMYSRDLIDGLCPQCRNIHHKERMHCAQCGREAGVLYTQYRLCDSCYAHYAKKQKTKKLLLTLTLFVIILLLLAWILFPSKQANKQLVPWGDTQDSIKIDKSNTIKTVTKDTLSIVNDKDTINKRL